MSRRPTNGDPEKLREKLQDLIVNFKSVLETDDLRDKVLELVPASHLLADLGCSLIPRNEASSARERILLYFQTYPLTVIRGDELMIVSGIQDWPRRVRELRVQFGWDIASGVTLAEMDPEDLPPELDRRSKLKPDEYVLLSSNQDRDTAYRWNLANSLRREKISVQDRLLKYLLANVGCPVSGEELRYVANGATEWARRIRELRTEKGWPVVTASTGRPDLPVGSYMLEREEQSPPHDRKITDDVRIKVLKRDGYACTECRWPNVPEVKGDPRHHLELHHVRPHAEGGENSVDNLVTLCNVCHDKIHRR
nr:HNH endonuclease [uncultured Dethiosulfovibrio sp.]